MNLTEEQAEALKKGETVRVQITGVGEVVILLPSVLTKLLEEERDKAAWARLARKAAVQWARENAG
jgi:hypothetical protein